VKSIPALHRLTDAERAVLATDGYVVRTEVFSAAEVAQIIDDCEQLVDDLVRDRQGHRMKAGSYVFDPDLVRLFMVKWEGDSDVVHGIEPCAHLSPALERWALDARFLEPMCDMVGSDDPVLFTEKLNLKRAQHGGVNPLHQDYPYWVDVAEDPEQVATSMLFLDDSTLENGCLCVVPGSHTAGVWQRRADGDDFAGNEIDAGAYSDVESVPVEVPAGSVVMFGSYLVHHSAPNTSDLPRRALLFSYQPAGRDHMIDSLRRLADRFGVTPAL
jgi:ectoine hydroxylase-related dioxygenase (phytanoyl-CoA dioxygenase family)